MSVKPAFSKALLTYFKARVDAVLVDLVRSLASCLAPSGSTSSSQSLACAISRGESLGGGELQLDFATGSFRQARGRTTKQSCEEAKPKVAKSTAAVASTPSLAPPDSSPPAPSRTLQCSPIAARPRVALAQRRAAGGAGQRQHASSRRHTRSLAETDARPRGVCTRPCVTPRPRAEPEMRPACTALCRVAHCLGSPGAHSSSPPLVLRSGSVGNHLQPGAVAGGGVGR